MHDHFPGQIAHAPSTSRSIPCPLQFAQQFAKSEGDWPRSQPLRYLLLAGSSLILAIHSQQPALANLEDTLQVTATPTNQPMTVVVTMPIAEVPVTQLPSFVLPEIRSPQFSTQSSLFALAEFDPNSIPSSIVATEFASTPEIPPAATQLPSVMADKLLAETESMAEPMTDRSFQNQLLSSDTSQNPDGSKVDLSPAIIKDSPVLQRWLEQVPDVSATIANSPSFRSRLRVGYNQFPSSGQINGWNIGFEDVFVGKTPLTVSGNYYLAFNEQRQGWGADAHYYLRPLGSYINIAPVVGYQNLRTTLYNTDGVNVGLRLLVVLSRGGGADFMLTQTWLAPGTDREIGLTTFSAGYALTSKLRLSADIQQQNAPQRQDSRMGIALEWLL